MGIQFEGIEQELFHHSYLQKNIFTWPILSAGSYSKVNNYHAAFGAQYDIVS